MTHTLRFLNAQAMVEALPMRDAIEGMKAAFEQFSAGEADVPLRARVNSDAGTTLVMPAYLQRSDDLGVKIVSVYPDNSELGLPTIYALVIALDPQTGQPTALLEGSTLTAIRTGAGSGAATDVLARADASSVAIIGSGVQARTQLEAVCTVRSITDVYVYSRTRGNAEAFAEQVAGQGPIPERVVVTDSANEAVQQADIVCTATTSSTPVFDGEALRPGTHINAVGSYTPQMQEVDATTIQRALVTVDSLESVMAEAGDLVVPIEAGIISQEHIHAEIGDVLSGKAVGRTSDEQITYFKSVGIAVQDAISASIALQHAERNNLGTVLSL